MASSDDHDEHEDPEYFGSRYFKDFNEISEISHGGFGVVFSCQHKLDEKMYAIKKICLSSADVDDISNKEIIREVIIHSSLNHQHIVRYHQAWIESGVAYESNSSCGTLLEAEQADDSIYLHIQMECCIRTLKDMLGPENSLLGEEVAWRVFYQILKGLEHIHHHGIIHGDLTPSNIFLDANDNVKIGDFGLARRIFSDHDTQIPSETPLHGTSFYIAPETRSGPMTEKVDIYCMGVIFFELCFPFSTEMERRIVLSDLREKNILPTEWTTHYPQQADILRRLLSASPSCRPTATETLQLLPFGEYIKLH
ncbi:eIF-2-alpha kinase GCN2-like isoform X1 [Typha angustifolia]|uniref:eIF-2-alpha kinase GCN2-like isoform X1 n=1 Tax=Typha angustifolia TaxID=59011 RepID=UPI003C3017C9